MVTEWRVQWPREPTVRIRLGVSLGCASGLDPRIIGMKSWYPGGGIVHSVQGGHAKRRRIATVIAAAIKQWAAIIGRRVVSTNGATTEANDAISSKSSGAGGEPLWTSIDQYDMQCALDRKCNDSDPIDQRRQESTNKNDKGGKTVQFCVTC